MERKKKLETKKIKFPGHLKNNSALQQNQGAFLYFLM